MKRKKNVTRFGYLDGWQRKGGSNCLKTEEEPHKLIVYVLIYQPGMTFLF